MTFSPSLFAALCLCFLSSMATAAEELALPRAVDFQADGATVVQRELPLLLMVSQDHCSFCELLKREILNPMLRSREYDDRVLIRELTIDPGEEVRDFAGETAASAEFAERYGVFMTPTLLFLDGGGEELTKRMVGINTPEMFGWYLDQSLQEAGQEIGRAKRVPQAGVNAGHSALPRITGAARGEPSAR